MISPRFVLGSLDLTDYPFMVQRGDGGADLGGPESTVDIIQSLLADGEIESTSRRSNRTVVIPVIIEGPDLAALSQAESLLFAECEKPRNTLTIDPGDGFGAVAVFETFQAEPRTVRSDDEEDAGFRRWTLTIRTLPYAHSVDKVIDSAGTPPSTGTIVDACESTTGWGYWGPYSAPAKSVDSVIFAQGTGSLKAQARELYLGVNEYGHNQASATNQDSKVVSISTGTGGYLSLLVRLDWPDADGGSTVRAVKSIEQEVGGVWSPVSFVASETLTNGFVRYSWPVAAGLSITGIRTRVTQLLVTYGSTYGGAYPFVRYDSITLSTSATTDTSIVKHFDVAGSARGPGSLHVAAPADSVALDKILVMNIAESAVAPGFRPDGARWIVSGSTYDVPVAMLLPGSYKIVALTAATGSPASVSVVAQTRVGGTSTGPTSTAAATVPTSASPRFTVLGSVTLPPMPLQNPGATSFVRLVFTTGATLTDFYMVPEGADYSIVSCGGTGTVSASGASSHLWIDSPTPDQPLGAYWRGVAADRTDARRMSLLTEVLKPSVHTFPPGPMLAFLKSTNANGPTLTLEHTPWWLGMPAS